VGFEYMTSGYAFRGFFLAGITDYRRGDLPLPWTISTAPSSMLWKLRTVPPLFYG
jgi:hypothetical protein